MGFRMTWLKCKNSYKCKNLINAYLKKRNESATAIFEKYIENKFNISGVGLFLMKADTDRRLRIK